MVLSVEVQNAQKNVCGVMPTFGHASMLVGVVKMQPRLRSNYIIDSSRKKVAGSAVLIIL